MSIIERLLGGENVRDVVLTEAAPKLSRDEIQQLDVDAIVPDQKDIDRADGLSWQGSSFYGDGLPFSSEASKMAKLITDPYKLVRRAKAVVDRWGTETRTHINRSFGSENVWEPFWERLRAMGFSREQIDKISKYHS